MSKKRAAKLKPLRPRVTMAKILEEEPPSHIQQVSEKLFRRHDLKPKTENHANYIAHVATKTVTIGIGSAGTGKTFMAVGAAVRQLLDLNNPIQRLAITRPVATADGDDLGFLPGTMLEKMSPYMRPIYDSLQSFISFRELTEMEKNGTIEVAPLAYMRGRTFTNTIMILDEAQNATYKHLKMFLTRLGRGSKIIITGDIDQCDISDSGLDAICDKLVPFDEVGIVKFDAGDVMRHGFVQKMLSVL